MHEKLAAPIRKNNRTESSVGGSKSIRSETFAKDGNVLFLGEVGTDHLVQSTNKSAQEALFPKGGSVTIAETVVGKDGKSLSLGEPFTLDDPLQLESFVASPFACGRLSDIACSHNTPG